MTERNEMVERCARAMHDATKTERATLALVLPPGSPVLASWEDKPDDLKEVSRKEVRAILNELREPTDAMVNACYETISCPTCGYSTLKEQAAINWQAAIDEALKP